MNLDPSNHTFDEKDLTIKVGTNNLYGYKLFVSTASSTSNTDLVNIADNTKTIENLNTSYSASDFENCTSTNTNCMNKWGYRLTPNAPASSGSYGIFTPSDSTPIMESTEPVNEDTATMGFAAKIDYNKPAGQYELDLSFKALPTVTTYYMQDIATDQTLVNTVCTEEPTVVIDKRDEQAYTIRRINGTCWMVENLQFTGTTMDSTTTNIAPEYTPQNPYVATYYDSVSEGVSGGKCNGDNPDYMGFNYACMHEGQIDIPAEGSPINYTTDTTNTTQISTVWYNYTAASAGTITGYSNTDPQLYDICPAGWRMPNDTEFNDIINNGTVSNLVAGGGYSQGGLHNTSSGYWWGANASNTSGRKRLGYYSDDGSISNGQSSRGHWNLYIRCVMKETNINNLTYMQDFAKLNESGNAAKKQQVFNSMEQEQPYRLTDIRENQANSYHISKLIDGRLWMVEDLQFTGTTMDSTTTNIASNYTPENPYTVTYYDLAGTEGTSTTGHCYGTWNAYDDPGVGNGYTYSCIHKGTAPAPTTPIDSSYGSTVDTVWYNYAAATAGTITGVDNTGTQTYDICPKGWRLPSLDEMAQIKGRVKAFYPIAAHGYINGVFNESLTGRWWSSTVINATRRGNLYYTGAALGTNSATTRYYGISMRCVL